MQALQKQNAQLKDKVASSAEREITAISPAEESFALTKYQPKKRPWRFDTFHDFLGCICQTSDWRMNALVYPRLKVIGNGSARGGLKK